MSTTLSAPAAPTVAGEPVTLERPSARKASRALAILRAITKAIPEIQSAAAKARIDYERENFVELDRVQARMRYPARPLLDDDGKPILTEANEPVLLPSPVDAMSDADWEAAGGVFRMPQSPTAGELIAAIADLALELAEEHVYRLVALFTMSNEDVARHWKAGDLNEALDDAVDDLLDRAYADELLELAVCAGELVEDQFTRKVSDLGARLGNLRRLFGMAPPSSSSSSTTTEEAPSPTDSSTPGPSSSTPTSSTDSPAPADTDGAPTTSSSSPGSSSSSSKNGSTPTTPSDERPNVET